MQRVIMETENEEEYKKRVEKINKKIEELSKTISEADKARRQISKNLDIFNNLK